MTSLEVATSARVWSRRSPASAATSAGWCRRRRWTPSHAPRRANGLERCHTRSVGQGWSGTSRGGGARERSARPIASKLPLPPIGARRASAVTGATASTARGAIIRRRRSGRRRLRVEVGPIDIMFLVERLESLVANGKPPAPDEECHHRSGRGPSTSSMSCAWRCPRRSTRRSGSTPRASGSSRRPRRKRSASSPAPRSRPHSSSRSADSPSPPRRRAGGSSKRPTLDADDVRRGADDYAVSVLDGLSSDVEKTLRSIEKGIGMLDERRASLQAAPPPEDQQNGHDAEPYEGAWRQEEEGASQPVRG